MVKSPVQYVSSIEHRIPRHPLFVALQQVLVVAATKLNLRESDGSCDSGYEQPDVKYQATPIATWAAVLFLNCPLYMGPTNLEF